jgi:hypothetical protein
MDRFKNESLHALRSGESDDGSNHCSVAVSPKHRSFNTKGIQKAKRLARCAIVKVCGKVSRSGRATIATPIGSDAARISADCGNLVVEGIHFVTPAAVKKQNGIGSLAVFAIVNFYRTNTGKEWGSI